MATKTRGKRRNPPKGFRSWKAYMASIRPGAKKKKRARSNPVGGSTVARKTRKRRKATGSHAVARRRSSSRSHATTRRRSRHRRNPPSIVKALPSFALGAAFGAVCATGGKVAARKASSLLKQTPGSVASMATQGLVGLGLGLAIALMRPQIGRDVALGGLQGPLEAMLTRVKVPFIADALGDEPYYLGMADGVDIATGGRGDLAGYVGGPTTSRFDALAEMGDMGATDSGARYVAGMAA